MADGGEAILAVIVLLSNPKDTPLALEKTAVPEVADSVPANIAIPAPPPEAVTTPLLSPNDNPFELEKVSDWRS